ncbi:AAA-like domain-containing protein [Nostoc sp.]|uniref:AAA-like domain-containing protein n=1 Tax=Nostoc sp. TaxID=1180 RepID=UPI002FF4EF18
MTGDYEYKVGGSLGEDAPSYVTRQADYDLYYGLRARELCYVFNSRQMGKTSLLVRTMKQLQADGFACAVIDISGLGSQDISLEQWYASIVDSLLTELNFIEPEDLVVWWDKSIEIAPVRRLAKLFDELLLPNISQNIVIFLDEIDSILRLEFPADDFFALIRSCYQRRSFKAEYRRLTFALVGVATPSDLIKDEERTPFNIGTAIQLYGFKLDEIAPLAKGLEGKVENPQGLIREVLAWTGGQPLLTQKVCNLLIRDLKNPNLLARRGEKWVEGVVRSGIIDNWEAEDEQEHLKTIRDRMLAKEQIAVGLLGLYQQILQQGEINVDRSLEEMRLRLTGLVVEQQGRLRVYNQIYANIFDLNWVENELGKLRFYADNLKAWEESGYQDESYVLRGEELEKARLWADGRRLSDADYRFLSASVQAELNQKVEEAEGRQNQALEKERKAKQRFTDVERKTKRLVRIGGSILAVSVIGAIIAGIFASNGIKQAQEAQEGTRLERTANIALGQFEKQHQEIDALLVAMDAGQRLKELVTDGRSLEKYPAVRPILALQTIIDNIQERAQFKGHQGTLHSATFSPDGQRIVTASDDKTAKVWDAKGNLLADLKGHKNEVTSAVFSLDGQRIVTASDDKTAKVWDTKGNLLADLKENYPYVRSTISPDGELIVTTSSNIVRVNGANADWPYRTIVGNPKLWDTKGNLVAELKGHQGVVNSVVFSPDGQRIVTASLDNTAKVWDVKGNLVAELKGHQEAVTSAVFSPDGQRIVTASDDGTAKVWDIDAKRIKQIKDKLLGNQVHLFDFDVAFSPDKQRIFIGTFDTTAQVWDVKGNLLSDFKGHKDRFHRAAFSPNGERIVIGTLDGTAKVWDMKGNLLAEMKGHNGELSSITFSPDGQLILTTSGYEPPKVWDTKGNFLANLWHKGEVTNAVFSPDGQRIVTASDDGSVKVWDVKGNLLTNFQGHSDRVRSIAFSPDGQWIVTTSFDNTAKVWDTKGNLQTNLKGHQKFVISAAFSPDGQHIVTASDDGTAKMWDRTGNLIADLKGHQQTVISAVFSPDGKRILTESSDDTAKVWDTKGNLLADLKEYNKKVSRAAFSSDGKRVFTVFSDGSINAWQVGGLDDLLARGCNWLQDYLVNHPETQESLKVCQVKS